MNCECQNVVSAILIISLREKVLFPNIKSLQCIKMLVVQA